MTRFASIYYAPLVEVMAVLGAGAWLVIISWCARRWPAIVFFLLTLVIALTPNTGPQPIAYAGGLALLPVDLIILLCLTVTFMNRAQLVQYLGPLTAPLIVFSLLLVLQTIVGFVKFGTQSALDVRLYVAFLAVLLFVVSLQADKAIRLTHPWLIWSGFALLLAEANNIRLRGFGNADLVIRLADGSFEQSRPLVAQQAVLLAAATLVSLNAWLNKSGRWFGLATIAFSVGVVISQQRTVWIGTIVGIILLVPRVRLARVGVGLASLAFVGAILWPILSGTSEAARVATSLTDSAVSASLTSGTGRDRFQSNLIFLDQAKSNPVSLVSGTPFGSGYFRVVAGRPEAFSPHNAYIQTLLRTGLIGLGAVLTLIAAAAKRAVHVPDVGALLPSIGLFATFSIAYGLSWEIVPLVALALTWRFSQKKNVIRDAPASQEASSISV